MRVGTYNLLHGLSPTDGLVVGDRLTDAIASLDVDVLGLQEVDVAQPRSGGAHQVRDAARALGASWWCFAPSVRGTPGEPGWQPATAEDDRALRNPADEPYYGVGLVSRLPVVRCEVTRFDPAPVALPLLVPAVPRPRVLMVRDEPRAAIAAVLRVEDAELTVVTAHLSFVPGWNVRQLRALRSRLAGWPRPLLLLGDLNLPGPVPSRVTGWVSLARAATYPSGAPRIQFDHVLLDGTADAVSARVHALPVSDHAAVTVDVPLTTVVT